MQRRTRTIVAAIMIALATVPGLLVLMKADSVSAQGRKGGGHKDQSEPKKKTPDDGQYKSAIERLPDKKYDPWQNMR